jgi:hypothetical protein
MPEEKENLKHAIADERSELRRHRLAYDRILRKMKAYQEGTGPAPTTEEFQQWRVAVEEAIKVKAISAGLPGI